MTDQFEIFNNKRPDRTYISPAIDTKNSMTGEIRKIRIVSKVIDSPEEFTFAKIKDELVIRVTSKQREELVAKFFEDNRGVFVLTFQKFSFKTGNPYKASFSFIGDEIKKIVDFIHSIIDLPLDDKESIKIDDEKLKDILLSKEQTRKLFRDNEEILIEFLKNDITKADIVTLGYRKKQLSNFEQLLSDSEYFEKLKSLYKVKRDERLWQLFFEKNTWIFGYGLNYLFNSPLEDKKLEQVVSGYDFNSSGKRVDALLKTRGLINSLCFAEIKTPNTDLIKDVKNPYRLECWQISEDLSGAVAQIQKTVQKSIKNISTKTEIKDDSGNLTGEQLFLYQPKSILIIGNLKQFIGDSGINEDKFSSFELFRQNLKSPEIITFDELFERAKYIIKNTEKI
jgi:hypothetical protein